jgi:hypothetical protein
MLHHVGSLYILKPGVSAMWDSKTQSSTHESKEFRGDFNISYREMKSVSRTLCLMKIAHILTK